jgi:hypothetical protein
MAEKERPYHIQAIYDLKADYSPEHFRFAIGERRKVIAQLIAEDKRSDQQVAMVRILRYLTFNFRGLSVGLKMKPT